MTPGSLGLFWSGPDDPVDRCECGAELIEEPCRHDNCPECRDASECCLECSVCHRYVEADEFDTDEMSTGECIDCQVAAQERAERFAGSDECWREDAGRERYYEHKFGGKA